MKKRKLILGIFNPVLTETSQYVNRLQGLGEIRFISARQENLGPIDLLLYPDGMGIFPDTPGLSHGDRVFTPSKSLNPYFYLFWNERPFQTIIEERSIPIIGVGDAAAMIFSELGGKLSINFDGTCSMLRTALEDVRYINSMDYPIEAFESKHIYGVSKIDNLSLVLKDIIEDILDDTDDNDREDIDENDGPDDPPSLPRGFVAPIIG